ncbi:uncharacterized protein LOC111803332 [Cucurbita pepo subsp. pepo]|uniref:uncharacterized protein LOC111803332 n=1 Tax=Cucurbita pepo subsp. pepo TaxID=3664 RepID=UPI000C9D7C1B|nr:uncharacterized protein LOC111803332 [Cucurbita pepo subsp. pepo]
MGKNDGEQPPQSAVGSRPSGQASDGRFCCGCVSIRSLIGFRCIFILLLSVALFVSAVFGLPPFLHYADQKDLGHKSPYRGHDILATFNVERPVSLLRDNVEQLQTDIFEEFPIPSIKVDVLYLDSLSGSNCTKVVFSLDSDTDDSEISQTYLSLIRSTFASLVTNQSFLHVTKSMFGEAFSFEVLKFPGGITIIPPQSAFLLQKVQILFNFTLNFSVHQIQVHFGELTSQLEAGLRLAPYEILYIKLWNAEGSTMTAPTIVQSSVLLEVGNTPSMRRLKQLAQTISGSNSSNLGLNNTEFGKVKQVRLSSILKHSLNGSDGNSPVRSPSPAPAPAPTPQPHNYHHPPTRHHHHHHTPLTPAISPAPTTEKGAPKYGSPAPERTAASPKRSSEAEPPGCQYRYKRKSSRKEGKQSPVHSAPSPSPKHRVVSPAPALAPLPNVVYTHVQPPSKSNSNHHETSTTNPSFAPSPSPSGADRHRTITQWGFTLFLILAHHM